MHRGRRLIEKHGILDLKETRRHDISDTDMDRNNGRPEAGRTADPKGALSATLIERLNADVLGIETQTVVRNWLNKDIPNCLEQRQSLALGKREQVEVACCSERVHEPCGVKHCSLERELLPMG